MEAIDIQRDVIFSDVGGRPLKLDIYKPSAGGNGAAVLLLHGGGWSRGSKDMLAPHATALAEQGFVAIASEYRLTGEARFPAQIHDTKRAIRWVRSHAGELGFDPDRICLEGHSAGASASRRDTRTPRRRCAGDAPAWWTRRAAARPIPVQPPSWNTDVQP